MSTQPPIEDTRRHKLFTASAYALVAIVLLMGWRYAELDLITAKQGTGYWLGILGASLMALLLLYPARKRARSFRNLGPVRYWFRAHMIFGVLGPVLVIFHSNFELGSLNSRIALFCTIIVALSGIVGRYLYAHLHYGLYGKKASLVSLRKDISEMRGSGVGISKLIPTIHEELNDWEDEVLTQQTGLLSSFWQALSIGARSRWKFYKLRREAHRLIMGATLENPIIDQHRKRLQGNTDLYLKQRVSLLRKFAQHRVFERLFSLWHIVHYPLFLVLVLAATTHVIAVHMY